MADEIELKLELTPQAADLAEASAFLSGDPAKAEQRSVYFDTPDRRLLKAGLSLRIRSSGGKRVQTVKGDGASAAGLFVRPEWERAVKGDRPVLDDSTPIRALLGERASTIKPAFEVHVERRTWNIEDDATTIELVLDRGEIIAGDRRAAICEIELELKQGDPAALFALARKIDAAIPVRLGVLSKADRGYRLREVAVAAVKAEPVALDGGMTAAQAFQQIAGACIRQFRLNEALLKGRGAEALHQARVGLSRLRAAFWIYKAMLPGEEAARLRADLRWLAAELGGARNLDVLIERAAAGPLHGRLEAAREALYTHIEEVLASARTRSLMLDLAECIADGDWLKQRKTQASRDQPSREFARSALDRLRKKVKRDGRDLAVLDDAARHEVRKDAKRLRYAAEFFVSVFDDKREKRRHKRFIGALERLQNELGTLNDLAIAPMVLDRLGLGDDPGAQALLAPGRKKALLEAAAEAHEELLDSKRFWR